MKEETKLKYLSYVLYVFGAIFIVGIWAMMQIWPAGWTWEPRQAEYEQMLLGVYATLGVFLILAAKNPMRHRSLIWFTIWSSLVHAAIMMVQAMRDVAEKDNLIGDVPALFLVAFVLWFLMPKSSTA
ncbi:MAG: hypothetical protein IIC61_01930 [Proteobacteria bacterium]|nr:hypothetical protein [Pseudomonadota bacterium]